MSLGLTAFLIGVVVTLAFGTLLWVSPAAYGYFLMEDTPSEWLGFILLVFGAVFWMKGLLRRWVSRQWLGVLFCLAMVLLSLFVAGEEISWGQRILGFRPPDYFVQYNVQRELTVHNLSHPWMQTRRLALAFMLGYGLAVPALAALYMPFNRLFHTLGLPVVSVGISFVFAVSSWLMTCPVTGTDDEVGELLFVLAMSASALWAADIRGRRGGRALFQASTAFLVLSFIISMISFHSSVEREHLTQVGHLQAGQAFEGRGLDLEAASEYEKLARYWETDWNLWVKVLNLYYSGGDIEKTYSLASEFLRIHRREWRVYEILIEIGQARLILDDIDAQIREIREEEPENEYAEDALFWLEELILGSAQK